MKKVFVTIACAALALHASAQTWQDALLFSRNDYSGSARSVGMGGAMTALGGDPGSLTFNPAGSAVASYSQVVLTPGLSFAGSKTQGVSEGASHLPVGLGNTEHSSLVRFKLPNAGVIIHLPTGNRYGLRSSSLGVMVNSTADYTGELHASGINGDNSFAGSLASSARGFNPDVMGQEDWFYDGSDYARLPAWIDMTGYRAGLFDAQLNDQGQFTGDYVGATDFMGSSGRPGLIGPLDQEYGQKTTGYKSDILFNYAVNFNDNLFIGANLGVTTLSYGLQEYWAESANNPNDFVPVQYEDGIFAAFRSLEMKHSLSLKGTGAYFKLGALWRPVAGLRVGAAIQTPTLIHLTERYAYQAQATFEGRYLSPVKSPEDEWHYVLRSPFRANVGVAYTLGRLAAVSLDYELTDYGNARFLYNTDTGYSEGNFNAVNDEIEKLLGASHIFKAGLEVKPIPALALRAGYNYITSAQYGQFENGRIKGLSAQERRALATHQASLGAGLSLGAFFADVAVRMRFVPFETIVPYVYWKYETDETEFYRKTEDTSVLTPMVRTDWTLVQAFLTLGWRF